jgi:hypothetical protein
MMILYSPQKFVNFEPMKIDPLSIINFSGTPNIDKIFSLRKVINSSESTFYRAMASYHFCEIIICSKNV